MGKEGLEYTIKARDEARGVLRKALGDIQAFTAHAGRMVARPFQALTSLRGVGLQANINLLKGMAGQMDALIDRGGRMDVAWRSFQTTSGASGRAAARLARDIRDAAQGTLAFSQTVELANQALARGMSVEEIKTTLEFVSRKAFTMGRDVGQSIDRVFRGLASGSRVLFLAEYGVLRGGIESVRDEYERLRGAGAWDALDLAGQKAKITAAVISDMRGQIDRMGVSGREFAFQFDGLKGAAREIVDTLVRAVTGNDRFRRGLTDVNMLVQSIADALGGDDQAAMFGALIGGARNLLGSIVADVGTLLGHGLTRAAHAFFPKMIDGAGELIRVMHGMARDMIDRLMDHATVRLARIPMLGGQFDAAEVAAAKERITRGGGGEGLARAMDRLRDVFKPTAFTPFGRTAEAWGGLTGEFRDKQFGRDLIERQDQKARERVGREEMIRLRRQLRREEHDLVRMEEDERMRPAFLRGGRRRVRGELAVDPQLRGLSRQEREARAWKYAGETRESEITAARTRVRDLRGRIGERSGVAATMQPTTQPAEIAQPTTQPTEITQPTTQPTAMDQIVAIEQERTERIVDAIVEGFDRSTLAAWPALEGQQDSGVLYARSDQFARRPGRPPNETTAERREREDPSRHWMLDMWASPLNGKHLSGRERGAQKMLAGSGLMGLAAGPSIGAAIGGGATYLLSLLGGAALAKGGLQTITGNELGTAGSMAMSGTGGAVSGGKWGLLGYMGGALNKSGALKMAGGGSAIGVALSIIMELLSDKISSGLGSQAEAGNVRADARTYGAMESSSLAMDRVSNAFEQAARRHAEAAGLLARTVAVI